MGIWSYGALQVTSNRDGVSGTAFHVEINFERGNRYDERKHVPGNGRNK